MPRTFAIGDIHGCYSELVALLEKADFSADDRVVAVGDLIVKGRRNREVLDLFIGDARFSSVIGNHDLAILNFWRGQTGSDGAVARHESVGEAVAAITMRLLMAALLGTALAFRPRRRLRSLKRNPFVGQTQILLAVVTAALMIIVGDNAARAFGIFAAVSLVRFRTNIRDPKEITVLLISLAVGLGAGVGRWELALILTAFSLIVLWILEHREAEQVSRAMDLSVTTRDVAATQTALRKIFDGHGFEAEIRGINRETSDEPLGSLNYLVDVSPLVTTDEISAEILGLDSTNVAGIKWKQKKSFSYMYQ